MAFRGRPVGLGRPSYKVAFVQVLNRHRDFATGHPVYARDRGVRTRVKNERSLVNRPAFAAFLQFRPRIADGDTTKKIT